MQNSSVTLHYKALKTESGLLKQVKTDIGTTLLAFGSCTMAALMAVLGDVLTSGAAYVFTALAFVLLLIRTPTIIDRVCLWLDARALRQHLYFLTLPGVIKPDAETGAADTENAA